MNYFMINVCDTRGYIVRQVKVICLFREKYCYYRAKCACSPPALWPPSGQSKCTAWESAPWGPARPAGRPGPYGSRGLHSAWLSG